MTKNPAYIEIPISPLRFVLLVAGIIALASALCMSAQAEWFKYQPEGAVDGQGIFQEVLSRCDEAGRRTARDPSKVTYCHEATHMLNSRIRRDYGGGNFNAVYVGNGRAYVAPEPKVTLRQISEYVDESLRNSTYKLYFIQQQRDWNEQPLYILDEWTAYANGSLAAIELDDDPHGTYERALWFNHFADCLIQAVQDHDPGYSHLEELTHFVTWHKRRVEEITGGRTEADGDFMADIAPEFRHRNRGGSCVHMSTSHILHYVELHKDALDWIERYRGGESPGPHKRKLDAWGGKYAMTTDADDDFLEWCIANRRMVGVTTKPAHCLNLVGRVERDGEMYAVLLDNNRIDKYEYEPWDSWYRKYKRSGWAFTILDGDIPPPTPQ